MSEHTKGPAKRIQQTLCCIMVFMAGFVCALNLSSIHPNQSYDGNWGSVAFSLVLAFLFGFGCISRKGGE